ncbi:hypothetical protein, partial [Pseudomonas aeruginosa]|uniref:hypothetical protein n=1 Tax=Pseudomonas aeruginosa TaxID=287 RepID=UPI001CD30D67
TAPGALERQHQELGAGTNRVPEPGAGSGTAANIKGSVTRSRDNYLENRRSPALQAKARCVQAQIREYPAFENPASKVRKTSF